MVGVTQIFLLKPYDPIFYPGQYYFSAQDREFDYLFSTRCFVYYRFYPYTIHPTSEMSLALLRMENGIKAIVLYTKQ